MKFVKTICVAIVLVVICTICAVYASWAYLEREMATSQGTLASPTDVVSVVTQEAFFLRGQPVALATFKQPLPHSTTMVQNK